MSGLVVDDPFKPGDVLLAGLDQGRARNRCRVLPLLEKLAPRQGQQRQELSEHTVGIPVTIDQDLPNAPAGGLAVRTGRRGQIGRASQCQVPRAHHAVPRGPDEPLLNGTPSGLVDRHDRIAVDSEKTNRTTHTGGDGAPGERLERVVIR
jgi:hypothetical protein